MEIAHLSRFRADTRACGTVTAKVPNRVGSAARTIRRWVRAGFGPHSGPYPAWSPGQSITHDGP